MAQTISIPSFIGGLNTSESTTIEDNQLTVAKNVYYDNQGILSSRKGISNFGTEIPVVDNQHSIYFTRLTDGTRILLVGAGTQVYRYNETTSVFDSIDTVLTDGQRLSFITYKDIVYWANGVEEMRSYDGTTVTELTLPAGLIPNYLAVDKDVIYTAGVTSDPSTLFYTDANPDSIIADGFANNEPVNQDEGTATGLHMHRGLPFVGKSVPNRSTGKGLYQVNTFATAPTVDPVDHGGDVSSNRSMINVENDLMFLSTTGYYALSQRRGTTGTYRALSFSNNIQKEMDKVIDKSTVAAVYWPETKNIYLSVNSGATKNNKLFVYSLTVSVPGQRQFAWTEYENINANDFAEYEDSEGVKHLLIANAFGGQVIEIETGFSDNGIAIRSEVQTKTFDFNSAEILKTYTNVDVGGLISRQQELSFKITTDGVDSTKSFTGSPYVISGIEDVPVPLGIAPLGEDPVGGGAVSEDGITLFPFMRFRHPYSTGYRMSMNISGNNLQSAWKLTKAVISIEPEPQDVQYNDYIS